MVRKNINAAPVNENKAQQELETQKVAEIEWVRNRDGNKKQTILNREDDSVSVQSDDSFVKIDEPTNKKITSGYVEVPKNFGVIAIKGNDNVSFESIVNKESKKSKLLPEIKKKSFLEALVGEKAKYRG